LSPGDLARGNGVLEMANFIAIILGIVAAGLLYEAIGTDLHLAGVVLVVVALLGLGASLCIRKLPAAALGAPIRLNPIPGVLSGLGIIWPDRTLRLTAAGVVYFWSLSLVLVTNLVFYGDSLMELSEREIGLLSATLAVGIGVGSALAGVLSRRKVELGLVPIGSLGMAVLSVSLYWTWRMPGAFWWTVANLAALGLAGGCFIVPLQTLLQEKAPAEKKGTVIAVVNLFAFTGMLAALGILWLFLDVFSFDPAQFFAVAGAATFLGTVYVLVLLPEQMVRLILYIAANTIYRVRVVGAENIPARGPALLVANHVSFADGLLILASTHRFIRFLVHKDIARLRALGWLARIMKVIPVSSEDGPRAILGGLKSAARALEAGDLVCIFAEGQISRTGQMLPFRAGAERILKNFAAPVIPVHLDQVWGSIFSFSGRRFFWKVPLRVPYPVTVSFGKPIQPGTSMEEVREAVQDLGSSAFQLRRRAELPLPWSFLRYARKHPLQLAMVDSTGKSLTYGRLIVAATRLARLLGRVWKDDEVAGILLPPSVGGAVVNIAASLLGKPVVNLNYTASEEAMRSALEQTRSRNVVSSRAFLEKVGLKVPATLHFVEDLAAVRGGVSKLLDALAGHLLPRFLLRRWIGGKRVQVDDMATIIFSSGSTGDPKGVLQSHFNIISNIQSVTQVMELGPRDHILGILPFFHSTGYTGCLWAPLLTGMVAVYHANPLDARTVGEMVKKHGVTIIFATPTFFHNYARRCNPSDFGSVTFALAGAEKLMPAVADLFQERFGIEIMEGYGCTETSPMISVNVPNFRGRGFFQVGSKRGTVGHPLPGVSARIVDPETGARLPTGKAGMLLVRGPNVMQGYLGKPEATAEVIHDGWYRTGDIALLDEDGFLTITDRLSRFSKIGGEMVPHIKVEEALHNALGLVEPALFVTSLPDERKGERLVVLHTLEDDKLRELFEKLPGQNLPNLWVPKQEAFVRITEVPRLGTGKVDLKKVRETARAALGPESVERGRPS
ncbi:MAG TPA: MFS transporter, partial [Planctomycetota bacterium]|nr:MFS transporter [Planctomycetota bacterium]